MNKRIFLISLFVLSCLLMTFTGYGADNRYRIAVLPFDDGSIQGGRWWGANWKVGRGVSDELVTALINTGNFRLIEREQLDKILNEQDLGAGGRVDPSTAAKIRKILGVQYLVVGRITDFTYDNKGGGAVFNTGAGIGVKQTTARVSIDARLVDTSTAEIIASVTGKGERKKTNVSLVVNWNALAFGSSEFHKTILGEALRDAVNSLATQLSQVAYKDGPPGGGIAAAITGYVADMAGNKVYINIGSRDGVQQGMVFVVHHVIRLIKDPKTGEVIDEVTEPVAEISVAEVKEKSSTCLILNRLSNQYWISVNDLVKQKL